jgi:hypothetical protein
VDTKSIGAGQFVIGTTKVRPRVDETFKRDEKMGIYVQLYNFEPDEKTKKPDGSIEYKIVKAGTEESVLDYTEDLSSATGHASQMIIEKLLPLQGLEPGKYELKMKVLDKKRDQTITPTASFTVVS